MNRLLIIAILCGIVGLEFAFPKAEDAAKSRVVAHNPGLRVVAEQTAIAKAADKDTSADEQLPVDDSLLTRIQAMLR